MKFKTNAIIGLIFLVLFAFVYFYEIKGGEDRRKEADKSKQLLDFTAADVQRLTLSRGDTTIVLHKGLNGWKLSSPVVDEADEEAVERYLRNLGESEREKIVVDSAAVTEAEAAKYGLDTPRLTVSLQAEGGIEQVVKWGTDSPTDRFTYGQISGDNPEIFVVRAWRFDNLDKSVFDLRDRQVLAFAKDEVVEVHRDGPGGKLVLVHGEENWLLSEPVVAFADEDEVNALLNKIDSAEIEAFVDEKPDPEDLQAYGFGAQQLELAFIIGPDRAEKRLTIGWENGQGHFYARDASRPQVFLIDSTVVQQVSKSANELRNSKPLRFDREAVAQISLAQKGQQIFTAAKDTLGVWNLMEPAGHETKSWKLNSLLTDLEQLEVKDFAVELPTGAVEVLAIELMSGGQTIVAVQILQAEGRLYLQQQGDNAVYVVSAEDFAELDLALADVAQAPKEPADVAGGTDGG